MNNEQRKHFDPIGSAILEALSDFVGEIDPEFLNYKKLVEAAPPGAIAVICRTSNRNVTTMPLPDAKLELGSYLFLGAPVIAKSDQANAAVQAMGNLGYRWNVGNHSWTKPIDGLDSKMHVDGDGAPARRLAAVRTCVELGYTYNGGPTWDAPISAQLNNLFPGQQFGQADAGVVAAAQGMTPELEKPYFHIVMDGLWSQDEHWTVLASTIGLEPEDRSPVAVMAARTYMACTLAHSD